MEISKKTYIKGPQQELRAKNLQELAKKYHNGNWSEMVNEALNEKFNLDPVTGEVLARRKCRK